MTATRGGSEAVILSDSEEPVLSMAEGIWPEDARLLSFAAQMLHSVQHDKSAKLRHETPWRAR